MQNVGEPESDSVVFYYTVEPVSSMNPPNGERTKSTRQPQFVWARLLDSTLTGYQFQLDDDYLMGSPSKDTTLSVPRYTYPVPLDTGTVYYWRVRPTAGAWTRTMAVYIGNGCCIGNTGNVDGVGIVDLSDLSFLVDFLSPPSGPALPCHAEGNINAEGIVDLSDLSFLVDYLSPPAGPALPTCP